MCLNHTVSCAIFEVHSISNSSCYILLLVYILIYFQWSKVVEILHIYIYIYIYIYKHIYTEDILYTEDTLKPAYHLETNTKIYLRKISA